MDTRRGAVWLFEVGNENLEGAFEEAPNLGKWLETLVVKARRVTAAKPKAAPVAEAPSVLCFKFLLDRKLIEPAHPDRFSFGTFADFEPERYRTPVAA